MSLNQPLSENSKDAPNKIVEKKSEQLKKNNTKTLPHTIRQNDISIEDEDEIIENYPYEFFDDIENSDKKIILQPNLSKKIIILKKEEYEPEPEPDIVPQKPDIIPQTISKQKPKFQKLLSNKSIIKKEDDDYKTIDFDKDDKSENRTTSQNNTNTNINTIIINNNIVESNKLNVENIEKECTEKIKQMVNSIDKKKLIKDLYEKKKNYQNAHNEYLAKLEETMNIKVIDNNYKNKNNQKFLRNNSESCLYQKKINNYYKFNENYINRSSIILLIKQFLYDFNTSILNRVYADFSGNPKINYEQYIDILNDLYYINQNDLPQIYVDNTSLYKELYLFLLLENHEKLNNNTNSIINNEKLLESNKLLIYLLILNGFFDNNKIIDELKIELNWLKFEEYSEIIKSSKNLVKHSEFMKNQKNKNIVDKSKYGEKLFLNKTPNTESINYNEELLFNSFNNHQYNYSVGHGSLDLNKNSNDKNTNFSHTEEKMSNKIYNLNKSVKLTNNNKQNFSFKPRITSNTNTNDFGSYIIKENHNLVQTKKNKSNSFSFKKKQINSNCTSMHIENNNNKKILKNKNKYLIEVSNFNNFNKTTNNGLIINNKSSNNITLKNLNQIVIRDKTKNEISHQKYPLLNQANKKSGNYSKIIKKNRADLQKMVKNNNKYDTKKNGKNHSKNKNIKNINYEDCMKQTDNNINNKNKFQFKKHQKNNIEYFNIKINEKDFILEYNKDDNNLELDVIQFSQKHSLPDKTVKIILEKIKEQQLQIQKGLQKNIIPISISN